MVATCATAREGLLFTQQIKFDGLSTDLQDPGVMTCALAMLYAEKNMAWPYSSSLILGCLAGVNVEIALYFFEITRQRMVCDESCLDIHM